MAKPTRSLLLLMSLLSLGTALGAQSRTPDPVLHRRPLSQVDDELDMGPRSSGRTILPLDASGAYALGAGGLIDVELQPDRLSGFLTRLGDRESDEGTPLTFFFASSHLAGQRMTFSTHQVHGLWFSFDGTIVRGNTPTRSQPGYYLLQGRLIMHDTAGQTEQARMVSLPLAHQ